MVTYCPYCMSPASSGQLCSNCGADPASYHPASHHFPMGQLLHDRYLVGKVLGEGGFGITYLGLDTTLERRVAIKEYFPNVLVHRESSVSLGVTCYTGEKQTLYEKGRNQFLQEARVVARLNAYPEIVQVYDFFPANNTAYIVMELLVGNTLRTMLAQQGRIPAKYLFEIMEPVLRTMNAVHGAGIIHRDISPDNLMLLDNGQVKLLDFGCARDVDKEHTLTVMLKHGYAPMEQYTGYNQGPWTDVYALCATLYHCLTGKPPPRALQRMTAQDPLPPPNRLGAALTPEQEQALIRGLAVEPNNRWQSMAGLYAALYGTVIKDFPWLPEDSEPELLLEQDLEPELEPEIEPEPVPKPVSKSEQDAVAIFSDLDSIEEPESKQEIIPIITPSSSNTESESRPELISKSQQETMPIFSGSGPAAEPEMKPEPKKKSVLHLLTQKKKLLAGIAACLLVFLVIFVYLGKNNTSSSDFPPSPTVADQYRETLTPTPEPTPPPTAATVGGINLSVAEMDYYYYNARMNEFYVYSYLGLSVPGDSDVRDSETGQTYRDYFLEAALTYAQEDIALANEARKNGHTEADVKDSLDTRIQSVKAEASSYGFSYSSYLKAMYGNYMSTSVFEQLYTWELLASLAGNDKYNELLDSYSEADLRAYYETDDNADWLDTFEYSYLYFTPVAVEEEDEDGNALDEAKANAEEALKAVKGGSSISDQADKYELADSRYSENVTVVGISRVISAVQDELLSMKAGDVKLVENGESGYYVVTLHSRKLVEDPTRDVRHILAMAETTTDADGNIVAPTDEAWAAAKAEIEAIQAEYEAGDKTEDSFAALANEKSDDGDGTTGGLYTKIGPNDGYVPEFLEWIYTDGRKVGDTGIVQHDAGNTTIGYWGYHFMYLVGDNESVWKRDTRETLAEEDTDAWLAELRDNYAAAYTAADEVGK